jgi:hypothetical protein
VVTYGRRKSRLISFRYIYMDKILSNSVHYNKQNLLKRNVTLYDIMCQYSVNLFKRMEKNALPWPSYDEFLAGVGIWHVHGHVRDCYYRYCPLFLPGVGVVDGEIVETIWSVLNRVARTTRHMSLHHRQEVINSHINYLNYHKMLGAGKLVSRHRDGVKKAYLP